MMHHTGGPMGMSSPMLLWPLFPSDTAFRFSGIAPIWCTGAETCSRYRGLCRLRNCRDSPGSNRSPFSGSSQRHHDPGESGISWSVPRIPVRVGAFQPTSVWKSWRSALP